MKKKRHNKPIAKKMWIYISFASILMLGLGLGIGYFIFSNPPTLVGHEEHQHNDVQSNRESEIWTCSMHPQIRQNEPGICPICEMDLIPLESNTSNDPLVLQMTEEAVKLSNIQTSIIGVESGSTGKIIKLTGKVQSDERKASSQVSHVAGRIEKLYVNFTGEEVMVGQKLADIYAPDLITAQQELLEALKMQEFNSGLAETVRQKLRYWKISDSAIRRIEDTGRIQELFPIYASENGVVAKRRIAVGDYVKQGESLFDLMDLSKVWVVFDAYEEDLSEIRIGNRIEFTASTIPNRTFKSNITFIEPLVNPDTRTISVRTEISNKNGQLKPGTLVYGELNKVRMMKGQATVPKTAVMWTGESSVVYVKLDSMEIPSFQFREVEIGEEIGNGYQIIKGLEKGEEVVTYGNFTIDAAAQLNNQVSMMNRNVSLKKDEEGTPSFISETPDLFKEQLNRLINKYFPLKDALVETDAEKAKNSLDGFLSELEKVDMKLLKGDAHMFWMEQYNIMSTHSKKLTVLDDVEKQRIQFGFVSDALITSLNAFGTKGEALYVQHCPMAFDNEGGDWIAKEEGIRNPYFGDKMMKCGLVKKSINLNQ